MYSSSMDLEGFGAGEGGRVWLGEWAGTLFELCARMCRSACTESVFLPWPIAWNVNCDY